MGHWLRLLLVAVLPTLGCAQGDPAPPRPDVLLIVVDTLRADHCSVYGYPLSTTPRLDRLAQRGTTFEIAYSPMGTTSPAHASLFTSRHPISHGLVRNGLALGAEEVTLPEILRAAGYRTAAFVSSFPVSGTFGFDQGFDHFDDSFLPETSSMQPSVWAGASVPRGFDRDASATTDAALGWLQARADEEAPLFVWVHYFDPHFPHGAPEPWRARFVHDPDPSSRERWIQEYDAEVAYADAEVGRLLDGFSRISQLGSGRDRLIVVTSDHGEGLWDHGFPFHDHSTYEEEVRVPLVLAWEGRIPAGHRLREPAHLVDLAPTILGALEIDAAAQTFQGADLMPLIRGERSPDPNRPVFVQRPFYAGGPPSLRDARTRTQRGHGVAVRRGDWKLFEAPDEGRRSLFDLGLDPGEQHDLAEVHPQRAEALSSLLGRWLRDQLDAQPTAPLAVPEGTTEGLRALGYLDREADE